MTIDDMAIDVAPQEELLIYISSYQVQAMLPCSRKKSHGLHAIGNYTGRHRQGRVPKENGL